MKVQGLTQDTDLLGHRLGRLLEEVNSLRVYFTRAFDRVQEKYGNATRLPYKGFDEDWRRLEDTTKQLEAAELVLKLASKAWPSGPYGRVVIQ